MALETDLSAVTTISSTINPINEVVVVPVNPPIDLGNTEVIAAGFHAGTIDESATSLDGIVGTGLNAAGFYGVGLDHKLNFFLGSQSIDYSAGALSFLGKVEAGELRLGNDVSADPSGVLTGSSYLRYTPSSGLEIVGGNISVSSGGYIWTGTGLTADPSVPTGVGLLGGYTVDSVNYDGLYAWNTAHELTVQIKASDGSFKVGSSTQYLEYNSSGLALVGGNFTVSSGNYIWVGDSTDLLPGVGLIDGLNVAGGTLSGFVGSNNTKHTVYISSADGKFRFGNDVSVSGLTDATNHFIYFDGLDLKLQNTNINITTTGVGYVWLGNTSLNQGCGLATGISGLLLE